jgi:hypothetical protein
MMRSGLVVLLLFTLATVSRAEPLAPRWPAGPVPSLRQAIQGEVARLAEAEAAATRGRPSSPATRPRSWFKRHPVWTAAIVGAASGFLVGYLPGDDAVFDDFTAGFNGTVMAGVGAAGGASVVAIVQALRRPLPGP